MSTPGESPATSFGPFSSESPDGERTVAYVPPQDVLWEDDDDDMDFAQANESLSESHEEESDLDETEYYGWPCRRLVVNRLFKADIGNRRRT